MLYNSGFPLLKDPDLTLDIKWWPNTLSQFMYLCQYIYCTQIIEHFLKNRIQFYKDCILFVCVVCVWLSMNNNTFFFLLEHIICYPNSA